VTSTREGAVSPIVPEPSSWRITYAEIATLAQVRRPVPTTWSRRHPDFPAPVTHEEGRPLFDARAVVDWLTTTGRGNAEPRRLQADLADACPFRLRSGGGADRADLPAPTT
jgi:hypothetical protein